MTDPHLPDCPIFDDTVADLLADCPPAGPIDLEREPVLIEDVALPTPGRRRRRALGDGDDEETGDAS